MPTREVHTADSLGSEQTLRARSLRVDRPEVFLPDSMPTSFAHLAHLFPRHRSQSTDRSLASAASTLGLAGRSLLRAAAMQVILVSACATVFAQERVNATPGTVLPAVTVTANSTRNQVEKSYRKMIKGMDLFEKRRSLAPAAALRFKLLPRRSDTDMSQIVLEVVSDTVQIRVPVAPDHTFVLERNPLALDEDAAVTPNRKTLSMTWRTEIRTPGLPSNVRRLGDLRLECQVGLEADLVSNARSFIGQITNFIVGLTDYCDKKDTRYLFFADRPLFSVALRAGARSEILSIDKLYAEASDDPWLYQDLPYCDCEALVDRTYFMPLGDHSWPDDTLVEFEYMQD